MQLSYVLVPYAFQFEWLGADSSVDQVPDDHWRVPQWINEDLWQESVKILKENRVQYADMKSYHQMCRWNSGMFYKHPALEQYQYYWRVEPNVHFFCDVEYDVFRYMRDNNKTYGFTINLFDDPKSIPSLWPETQKFLAAYPEYLHANNAKDWLTDSERRPDYTLNANGYSTCHFWSNFEIGDMTFWRSKVYEDYFNHLDRAGGFFYERWGDAPVHSIALALFEDKNRIHWYVLWLSLLFKVSHNCITGSATSATNTSPSSIARTRPSAAAASREDLLMARHGSIMTTAALSGSNTLI